MIMMKDSDSTRNNKEESDNSFTISQPRDNHY